MKNNQFKSPYFVGVFLSLSIVFSACSNLRAESTQVNSVPSPCSLARSQDHIFVTQWVHQQTFVIGIGTLHCKKTTKLSLKFLLDSNTGSASSYKLIPYVKAQSIGVIPIKKLQVDISKSTPLDSFKIFDAPAGDSQLIAVMAVPRLKTAGNLLFAEFNVQENRNPENTNKDRQIDGGIDYFINFVD